PHSSGSFGNGERTTGRDSQVGPGTAVGERAHDARNPVRVSKQSKVPDTTDRHFCERSVVLGMPRNLWSDLIQRGPADERDWDSNRDRRATFASHDACVSASSSTCDRWFTTRSGRCISDGTADQQLPVWYGST